MAATESLHAQKIMGANTKFDTHIEREAYAAEFSTLMVCISYHIITFCVREYTDRQDLMKQAEPDTAASFLETSVFHVDQT